MERARPKWDSRYWFNVLCIYRNDLDAIVAVFEKRSIPCSISHGAYIYDNLQELLDNVREPVVSQISFECRDPNKDGLASLSMLSFDIDRGCSSICVNCPEDDTAKAIATELEGLVFRHKRWLRTVARLIIARLFPNRIFLSYRHENPGFLSRTKDHIALAILSFCLGVLSTITTILLMGWLSKK